MMATLQELERALVAADQAGATEDARMLAAAVAQARSAEKSSGDSGPGVLATLGGAAGKGLGDVALGVQSLVGKGLQAAGDAVAGPKRLTDLVVQGKGNALQRAGDWLQRDADQGRSNMAAELAPYKEAHPVTAAVGETAGQVVGTIPVGAALGAGIKAAGLTKLGTAVGSAGMRTGAAPAATAGGRLADLAVRSAGGAINGAATAGLVDPEQATSGAVIGAVAPGVVQAAAATGRAISKAIRGPMQSPEVAAAVQAARDAGYVIPPAQANGSLRNRALEGVAGKVSTAQNASAKNDKVTRALAAKALGLPGDTPLTPDVLDAVRGVAGQAYEAVASLPARPAVAADTLTNRKAVAALDPRQMVFDLREARNQSTAYFKMYERTADPNALATAIGARATAKQLETTLEKYAASMGRSDLVPAMREARTLIAKTHSVEKALNPATGSVDGRVLARELRKGKPLTGELKTIADFASSFPKAAQTVEGMGSLPQSSPLDIAGSGLLTAITGDPRAMAALAVRPFSRSAALSPLVQNSLIQRQAPGALALLPLDQAAEIGVRSTPLIPSGDR